MDNRMDYDKKWNSILIIFEDNSEVVIVFSPPKLLEVFKDMLNRKPSYIYNRIEHWEKKYGKKIKSVQNILTSLKK